MRKQALDGIRVVDFSWIVAGPTCTRILADFGAEVIRVEYEQSMDYIRGAGRAASNTSPNASGLFNDLNRNKLGMTLNVRHPRGLETIKDLIAVSDVVVENFSATVLERWGLDYEAQREARPDVIYLSLSGFGHSGRDKANVTWGPTAQALSGLTFMSGLPGEEPAGWGFSYMDHIAGFQGTMAIVSALHHRSRTGQGQWIDMSQVESGIYLNGTSILDRTVNGRPNRRDGNPPGNRSPGHAVAPYNAYRCKGDDRWCAITIFDDTQWSAFVDAIGSPEWSRERRFATNSGRLANENELDQRIESWTINHTPHEVLHKLQIVGVPAGAVQTPKEKVDDDPQLAHRRFFPEADHPELNRNKFQGEPLHLSRSPWQLQRGAPLFGEHSEMVFKELLGIGEEEMIDLMVEGVT